MNARGLGALDLSLRAAALGKCHVDADGNGSSFNRQA